MARHNHPYVDTSRVIDEVRLRRCLWDASDPLYKNQDARNKAWEDVANVLFENTTEENEKPNVKIIQQRWRIARDAFFKTKADMKNQPSGSSAKKYKKYIYYEEFILSPSTENDFDESMTSSPLVIVTSSENAHSTENIASPENVTSPAILSENIASPENTVTLENTQRGSNPRSQNPWTQKRKYKRPQTNQESSQFEQQLLTLLANQTPDLAADDLAFFPPWVQFCAILILNNSWSFGQECYGRQRQLKICVKALVALHLPQDFHRDMILMLLAHR